jgi:hypothetical protein
LVALLILGVLGILGALLVDLVRTHKEWNQRTTNMALDQDPKWKLALDRLWNDVRGVKGDRHE